MLKLVMVIPRRPDVTHAYFLQHVATTHLQVVDQVPEFRNRARRYVQNHLYVDPHELASIHGASGIPNADGLIEVWFSSVDDMLGAFQEPRYMELIRPDEHQFGDVAGAWGLATHETSIMEQEDFKGLIKLFVFVKRADAVSPAVFQQLWRRYCAEQLRPSVAFCTKIGRYVENWVSQDPAEALPGMKPYDLVAEFWLEALDDVAAFTRDQNAQPALAAASFIDADQTRFYLGRENPAAEQWLIQSQRQAARAG